MIRVVIKGIGAGVVFLQIGEKVLIEILLCIGGVVVI
ncbi:hypothetical protein Maes01_00810 [Microbulbifer aestuariivivens]|uniref:Uncharacterized protein n=1 Tax=Microbulbifer aestuariivivens TaxID=1908308 RepID=A0ABP9WPA8_9GAMM